MSIARVEKLCCEAPGNRKSMGPPWGANKKEFLSPQHPPQSLGLLRKLSAARSLERHIGGQSCALRQRNPGQRGRGALGGVQASWDTVFLAFQFA